MRAKYAGGDGRTARAPAAASDPGTVEAGSAKAPVIVLSYGFSGAQLVQQVLAAGTNLACTSATGILPLCETAAATWARVTGQQAETRSRLAEASIRAMVQAQVAVILADAGGQRWCELATSPASAAAAFLRVFPQTGFVCVHRSCAGVIIASIKGSPWGLAAPGMRPFHATYPGNAVAAVASYWAASTEQLLAFQAANPNASSRIRYEDVADYGERALSATLSLLRLHHDPGQQPPPGQSAEPEPAHEDTTGPHPQLPVEMIPAELRKRIDRLHADLGYPPVEAGIS
jgi:sulfotransferase family protein